MPVLTRNVPRSRHGAAFLAVGGLAASLLVAAPGHRLDGHAAVHRHHPGDARFSPYVGKIVTTRPSELTAAYPDGGLKGFVVQTPGRPCCRRRRGAPSPAGRRRGHPGGWRAGRG
ncbi:MAG: hypothetical protein ACRYG2_36860, partial [Janthinobacterium lividum]